MPNIHARLFFLLMLATACLSAQADSTSTATPALPTADAPTGMQTDPIVLVKVLGGYRFSQGGKKLTVKKLVTAMQPNERAHELIVKAKPAASAASVFAIAGGYLIGWPIGTAVGGGTPNWRLAGLGAGLFVVSIPFSSIFNKEAKLAVETFNAGLATTSFREKPTTTRLSLTGNGVGLVVGF